jgi:ferredoxin
MADSESRDHSESDVEASDNRASDSHQFGNSVVFKPSSKRVNRQIKWVLLRRLTQTAAFFVFFAVLLLLTYPLDLPFDPRVIFHLDPLTHIWLFITRQPLYSIGWAITAFVLWGLVGRIFCGWFCPLGTLLDFSRWFVERFQVLFNLRPISSRFPIKGIVNSHGDLLSANISTKPKGIIFRSDSDSLNLPSSINLWLLGIFLVLAAFRLPIIWIFDPIVLTFKFITVALYPALDRPIRATYTALDSKLYDKDWWYSVNQFFNRFILPYHEPTYTDALLIVVFVLLLFVLQWHHRRWWCKYICPLGAMLRISYFFSPVKRRITKGCSACTLCEVECHFSGDEIQDCIYCMSCVEKCPSRSLSFFPSNNLAEFGKKEPIDDAGVVKTIRREKANNMREKIENLNSSKLVFNRRAFLSSMTAGVLVYPFLQLFNQKVKLPLDFIRPPGALSEIEFIDRCIKCGQCLKVCLTNGLQPSLFEAGLDGLWTPRLISRMGCCEFECNMCGRVCPTGAIKELVLNDKKKVIIGTAYVITDRCIPFVTDKTCIVCEEHCPTSDKAIVLIKVNATREDGTTYESDRPYVIQDRCIGCGICEFVCPLNSDAAIRVFRSAPKLDANLGYGDNGEYGYAEIGNDNK